MTAVPQNNGGYQFDENGVVVSDNMTAMPQNNSVYQFDENGVVIAE